MRHSIAHLMENLEKFVHIQNKGMLVGNERSETISKLIKEWEFNNNKKEFTILDVIAESNSKMKRWIVFDEGKDNISSMARTTGLVTLGFVDEILNGNIPKGVFAPEEVQNIVGLTERITTKLIDNGIQITESF